MRIISGKNKGKRLVAPAQLPVRPTTDFAKEALFNILNNHYYFDELSVLDLFAGTGNISYEFASRGASGIVSVDNHHGCVRYIGKIAQELDFPIDAIKSDVYEFLKRTSQKFDLIFADPPYDFEISKFENLVFLVFENQLLTDGGTLVIEHSKHTDLSELAHFAYDKRYGGSVFSFFELPPREEDDE
ncbi:MAG: RsmD family RNA methyltransferase [Capnocytophaga sp.]|nr:RsmD family RNA methyltransferase [Capnocytophaga sp.]